jgi:hypothetical protein
MFSICPQTYVSSKKYVDILPMYLLVDFAENAGDERRPTFET